jgi:hypothetical protein
MKKKLVSLASLKNTRQLRSLLTAVLFVRLVALASSLSFPLEPRPGCNRHQPIVYLEVVIFVGGGKAHRGGKAQQRLLTCQAQDYGTTIAISALGRTLVSKRTTLRSTIIALVTGAVLIVLGTVLIEGSRHMVTRGFGIGSADGLFVYYVWNEFQLAIGIALALVGTATSTATLTYMILTRKGKGV